MNILNLAHNRMKWICFFILFFNCLILSCFLKIDTYVYDSSYYWGIADPVYMDHKFKLSMFPETYRGSLFPLLILCFKLFFHGIWGWRILSAVMVSILLGVFVPYILKFQILRIKDVLLVILSELILFFIWGQFIQYPLSDMPATFFLVSGLYFILLFDNLFIKRKIEINSINKGIVPFLLGGGIGFSLYVAYNCRAAFLYGSIFAFSILLFKTLRKNQFNKRLLLSVLCGCVLGFGLASYPQCAINKNHLGLYSPKVYTEAYSGYNSNLQTIQVLWGLKYPRYEGYIGDIEKYKSAAVYFDDAIGNQIISKENISEDNFKLSTIVKVFIKYPLDTIGIYTRHLISLMTPAWNQVYITNLFTDKTFIILLSIAMWLLLGIQVCCIVKKQDLHAQNIEYVIPILIPAFLQLFGAPELRFFFPVYILLYPIICYKLNYREILKSLKMNSLSISLLIVIIVFLWITVLGDTLSMNREIPFLINDVNK